MSEAQDWGAIIGGSAGNGDPQHSFCEADGGTDNIDAAATEAFLQLSSPEARARIAVTLPGFDHSEFPQKMKELRTAAEEGGAYSSYLDQGFDEDGRRVLVALLDPDKCPNAQALAQNLPEDFQPKLLEDAVQPAKLA
ncbi:MAG: hypothetical protein WCX61_04215 [Candidatus Peribacteraceae bacterium]|jgi:hypothetical protein